MVLRFPSVFVQKGYSMLWTKSGKGIESERSGKPEKKRRRVVCGILLASFLICVVCLAVLLYSSSHLQEEVVEFSCSEEDLVCTSLLCPEGMDWQEERGECRLPAGYTCCLDIAGILSCQDQQDMDYGRCIKETLAGGVAPSPQAFCYPGFMWVPWRRKCFRRM